jgi:hypothetical protein
VPWTAFGLTAFLATASLLGRLWLLGAELLALAPEEAAHQFGHFLFQGLDDPLQPSDFGDIATMELKVPMGFSP